jgi:hypothetical protein
MNRKQLYAWLVQAPACIKTPEQQVLLALHRVRAAHRLRLQKPG